MRIWLMLTLSLIALGCSKKGKPCPDDGNCGSELACEPETKTCQSICAKPSDCEKGFKCNDSESVCFSPRAIELKKAVKRCKQDRDCKWDGECSLVNGKCIASKEEDCRKSKHCKTWGHCSLVNGECTVSSDSDCAQSDSCKRDGECSLVNGSCFPTKQEDCRQSTNCKNNGWCSLGKDSDGRPDCVE